MATTGSDGHIILETKVDTTGVNELKKAAERTNKSVHSLGVELSKALAEGDTKSAQLISNFKKAQEEVDKQIEKVKELKERLKNLEGGTAGTSGGKVSSLNKDLEKTNAIIQKTESEITSLYSRLEELQQNAFRAPNGDVVLTQGEQAEFEKINAKLDELEPKLEQNKKKAQELGAELHKAVGAVTQTEIKKTKQELGEAETKLENLTNKAKIAEQKMNGGMKQYRKEITSTENAINKLGKKIGRLAVGALVFSAVTKMFTELRKTMSSMLMSNEDFRNSVYMLQASLWTLAQPIYEAILPYLQQFVKWLTIAVLYVATFFSALGGKTLEQTMKSAEALNEQANAYENIAKSSKKATK